MDQKIILAGGTGFLGKTLSNWFKSQNATVIVLTRSPDKCLDDNHFLWDGKSIGPWSDQLERASAVINLSGQSVNCRYHSKNQKKILNSRLLSTRILGQAIQRCKRPPTVWLNSSTATIYKHTYNEAHNESGVIGACKEAKDAFSIEVAQAWEKEFTSFRLPATRKILLRTAMVFGNQPGGVYSTLRQLTKLGLGGQIGHGKQFVSWIHELDFCRSIELLINKNAFSGVFNIASPNPITNKSMMHSLRKILKSPIGLRATRWMLEIGTFILRTESELVLKSRKVLPQKLLDAGFDFNYPNFEQAIQQIEYR